MKTVVGNWKMNVGTRESVALARGVLLALRGKKALPSVVVCPPFPALAEVRKVVARSHVLLGAQDLFWEEVGAYTGEVSVRMLSEHGVTHAIVGHSERRALGETDEMVGKKVAAALAAGLVPILCVGESKAERAGGKAEAVVGEQLAKALGPVSLKARAKLMVAYEPVWAIGTGDAATPADAVAMHAFIRARVAKLLPSLSAASLQVLYGGSVDGKNAYSFLREKEVDGVLVGGASVKLKEFSDILAASSEVIEAQGD